MTSFIPFRLQPVDLSLYHLHSFRSHHFHNNAKHCFEGKYLSGTVAFHFGFSPFKDSRQFVSLIKYKNIPHVQNKTVQEECFYGGY